MYHYRIIIVAYKKCKNCGKIKGHQLYKDSVICKKFVTEDKFDYGFDFFEQEQIIHGETTPEDIINERKIEAKNEN